MHFEKDKTYHIYNRSNNTVFFDERNYLFLLWKVKKQIAPIADILAWCLMPNHLACPAGRFSLFSGCE